MRFSEIRFDYDRARYSVPRDALLAVVSELGIPADRWDHEPPPDDWPTTLSTTQPTTRPAPD